jgi:hypothetical protein
MGDVSSRLLLLALTAGVGDDARAVGDAPGLEGELKGTGGIVGDVRSKALLSHNAAVDDDSGVALLTRGGGIAVGAFLTAGMAPSGLASGGETTKLPTCDKFRLNS